MVPRLKNLKVRDLKFLVWVSKWQKMRKWRQNITSSLKCLRWKEWKAFPNENLHFLSSFDIFQPREGTSYFLPCSLKKFFITELNIGRQPQWKTMVIAKSENDKNFNLFLFCLIVRDELRKAAVSNWRYATN